MKAAFSEPVSGFTLDDIAVANGAVGNFAGSDGDAVYTFDVTPDAVGTVTVEIAAGAAQDAGGAGNTAAPRLSLGIPYDDDGDGVISKKEVIAAFRAYVAGRVAKVHVIGLFRLYVASPPPGPGTAATPGAPTGLTAAANGQTQIDLSWSGPSDDGGAAVTGYRIEVSADRMAWSDLAWRLRLHLHDPLPHRPDGGEHAALPGVGHQLRRRRQRVGHRHRDHGFAASSRVASHRQSRAGGLIQRHRRGGLDG